MNVKSLLIMAAMSVMTFGFAACSSDDDDNDNKDELLYDDVNSEYNDYVSVCGIKWARGNLQHSGEEWKIADHQWEYFNYVDGNTGSSVSQSTSQMDHFNWGVCGVNALTTSNNLCAKNVSQDISGKMFTDMSCTNETSDYSAALYGDIAYWATQGAWRLPTQAELEKLYNEASYQYGYYTTEDGKNVYGYLFAPPKKGGRVENTSARQITDEELAGGLFLPATGCRIYAGNTVSNGGKNGYYWSSQYRDAGNNNYAYYLELQPTQIRWAGNASYYGRSVRPVKN